MAASVREGRGLDLPVWVVLWGVERQGRNVCQEIRVFAVAKLEGAYVCTGDIALTIEELSQRALLIDDPTLAAKLIDDPMVSMLFSQCHPLEVKDPIRTENMNIEHSWLSSVSLEPECRTALGQCVLYRTQPQKTLAAHIGAEEPFYCFRFNTALLDRVASRVSTTLCIPLQTARNIGLNPSARIVPIVRDIANSGDDDEFDFLGESQHDDALEVV